MTYRVTLYLLKLQFTLLFICEYRTGRRKRGTQLRDHIPAENLSAMTIQDSSAAMEDGVLNGQTVDEVALTGKMQENEEQPKLSEKVSIQTRGGQKQASVASDEYQHGSLRSRRTGNKSSRGRDSRRTGVSVTQVREKPTTGIGRGQRSEVSHRPMRKEQAGSVNYPPGPVVSRTIYTSDRRMQFGGDSATDRLSSSSSVAQIPVTG